MSSEQPNTSATQPSPPPPNFIAVLREMLRASDKVSDLIFSPGRPPQIELAGKLVPVRIAGLEKLTPAHTAGIAKLIIGKPARHRSKVSKSQAPPTFRSACPAMHAFASISSNNVAHTRLSCALFRCDHRSSVISICLNN
jgi:hypothetical protein